MAGDTGAVNWERTPPRGRPHWGFLVLASLFLLAMGLSLSAPSASAAPGWELILDRPTPNFAGIDFFSESEGWLVAGAGLLHTTDGGATWEETAALTGIDVDFADADHGWLVGYSGSIYATADGTTWSEQTSGTDVHLWDVFAVSAQEAWAIGSGEGFSDAITLPVPSVLLHTTDGGRTWQQVQTPPGAWFREITFVGQQGWALGSNCEYPPDASYCGGDITAALLHTDDAGATWALLDANLPSSARSLVFVDGQQGWVLGYAEATEGLFPAVFKTIDGGTTWQELPLIPQHFQDYSGLAFQDAATGWLLVRDFATPHNEELVVMKTTDGGTTWATASEVPIASPQYARRLAFQQGGLYIAGRRLALRSTDDGASWQEMANPALELHTMDFVDEDVGFALSGTELMHTADSGRTWRSLDQEFPPFVTEFYSPAKFAFFDASRGVVASENCEGSCLLKLSLTTDGGTSWRVVESMPLDSVAPVMKIDLTGDAGLVVGAQGLLVTADSGVTWEQRRPPREFGDSITDADLVDGTLIWATVYSNSEQTSHLLRSEDAGRTWRVLPERSRPNLGQVLFVDRNHGWNVSTNCCAEEYRTRLSATTDGGATWVDFDLGQLSFRELVFADPLNGWLNASNFDVPQHSILHTADGGRTWVEQLSGRLLTGSLEFVDTRTGWFLLDPMRAIGLGGGPPQRTLLYHTTDAGGGPIGTEPTPPKLPDVGTGADRPSGNVLPFALLLAGLALALGGGLIARRRNR